MPPPTLAHKHDVICLVMRLIEAETSAAPASPEAFFKSDDNAWKDTSAPGVPPNVSFFGLIQGPPAAVTSPRVFSLEQITCLFNRVRAGDWQGSVLMQAFACRETDGYAETQGCNS